MSSPRIEREAAFSNQAAGTVILFTPALGGLFRVSLCAQSSSASAPGTSATVGLNWTDDNGDSHSSIGTAGISPGSVSQVTGFISVKGGTNITLTFSVTSPAPTYEAFAVVEKL